MQKSTVFLLIMALASAGVSAGLWMELRAERALNAELSERINVAIATPVAAPPPVTQLPAVPVTVTEPAVMPAPISASASAPTAEVPHVRTTHVAQASQEDWQARQRRLMNDPKYREAFREQQRLQLATRRENFIHLLGFTPEQADAVIELSLDRQMRWQDSGPTKNGEVVEREYQAKMRELLGEEKSAQLHTYMETRQSRMQVDRFRTQLLGAESLRDDQVEPLITALHAEQAQMQKELGEYRETLSWEGDASASSQKFSERQLELMKATNARMHSAASGILSNSQLQRLDAMLKRELERHEAQQRMARLRSKIEQPPAATTQGN